MLFASDLDRTLIYSNRFLVKIIDREIKVVEKKNGNPISFMTSYAVKLLKKVVERFTFVPVTTRTLEQYRRISLFRSDILPEYVVTNNGANILINGDIDIEWAAILAEKKKDCCSANDVSKKISEIKNNNWIYKFIKNEYMICCYIFDQENIPYGYLKVFFQWLEENGWRGIIQQRKIYFFPTFINKKVAVEYIAKHEGKERIIAAGDSMLDLDMFDITDIFLSPLHGEVFKKRKSMSSIRFTEKEGITAAEEILEYILSYY